MEKYIYETHGLWYERRGDYYFPCLTAEEAPPIGVWGQRHLRFIRQNRRELYLQLKTSGRLKSYLADIDQQAENMHDCLMTKMTELEGVTETLKTQDQMAWVRRMNSIRVRAEETVKHILIYT